MQDCGWMIVVQQNYQMQFEETQSIEIESSPALQYERCEYCSRNFFKGKLKYHLRLCTQDNPMTISPKRSARVPPMQKSIFLGKEEKTCQTCHARLPPFLYQKHIELCRPQDDPEEAGPVASPKSSTESNFKDRTTPTLPVIKRSARQRGEGLSREPYQVKLREELSCFRRAQDIKQVQCPACQRVFSREASLRHVPICQALRSKELFSIALRRKGNRSVGDNHTHRSGIKRKLPEEGQDQKRSSSVLDANPESSSFAN